jgi:hypothetical protein
MAATEGQPMTHTPLLQRISQPTPAQVRQARESAGLTQAQAAQLVSPSEVRPYRTWQNYETPADRSGHRPIPLALWELFLLMTQQHPTMQLQARLATSTQRDEQVAE